MISRSWVSEDPLLLVPALDSCSDWRGKASSMFTDCEEIEVEWEWARPGRQLLGGNLLDEEIVDLGYSGSMGEDGSSEKERYSGGSGTKDDNWSSDMTMLSIRESRPRLADAKERSWGSSAGRTVRCRPECFLLVLPCR